MRQGGVRNLLIADLIAIAAADTLVKTQPLSELSPEEAAKARKRMFVWMLKWKRKEAAMAAKENTQRCLREVLVTISLRFVCRLEWLNNWCCVSFVKVAYFAVVN